MATTILVNNNNNLIVTTSERIIQHSKNVHLVKIYVPLKYYNFEMDKFTATAEIVPPNQKYQVLPLTPELISEKEGYLQYNLEILSEYTLFGGEFQMELTFVWTDTDTMKSYVRHTTACFLEVTPIEKWNELLTDSALAPLDQKLIKLEADITVLSNLADSFNATKADNHMIDEEDGKVYLMANGLKIGDGLDLASVERSDGDDDEIDGIIDITGKYPVISI